jgi:hypothetical protein
MRTALFWVVTQRVVKLRKMSKFFSLLLSLGKRFRNVGMERNCKEVIITCDPTFCLLVLRIFSYKKAESQDARFLRHPVPFEFQAINHPIIILFELAVFILTLT